MQKTTFEYAVETVDRGATYDALSKAGHCFIGLKKTEGEWKEVWEDRHEATPEFPPRY